MEWDLYRGRRKKKEKEKKDASLGSLCDGLFFSFFFTVYLSGSRARSRSAARATNLDVSV